jgi:hypothetical protein
MTLIKLGNCNIPYIKNIKRIICIPIQKIPENIIIKTINDLLKYINNNYCIIINKEQNKLLYSKLKENNYILY